MEHGHSAQDPAIAEDAVRKAAELTAAREALKEARPQLLKAAERLHQQWTAMPVQRARDRQRRAEVAAQWGSATFQAVLCDYYTAQTYEDPKDPQRRAMLAKAAEEFDDIFQAEP